MRLSAVLALALAAFACLAADYPAPREADWVVRDFRFHTGETLLPRSASSIARSSA